MPFAFVEPVTVIRFVPGEAGTTKFTPVPAGGTATLSLTAVVGTAGGPLFYQWNKNNVPLSNGPSCGSTIIGANTATLTDQKGGILDIL